MPVVWVLLDHNEPRLDCLLMPSCVDEKPSDMPETISTSYVYTAIHLVVAMLSINLAKIDHSSSVDLNRPSILPHFFLSGTLTTA